MRLNEIGDNPGARKSRTRVGRGIGSGKGKTAGRGVKGQKARTGVSIKGFEGGQMPLHRRLPKRGFNNIHAHDLNEVNLGRVQQAVDAGRLDASAPVTVAALVAAGILSRPRDGVKLLGVGELTAKLSFEVTRASKSAVEAVERAGGSVTVAYAAGVPHRGVAEVASGRNPKLNQEIGGGGRSTADAPSLPIGVPSQGADYERANTGAEQTGTRLGREEVAPPRPETEQATTTTVGGLHPYPVDDMIVSPQELLASMRSIPPKDRNEREAAIRTAARLLAAKDDEGTLEVRDNRRRELLPLARELVRTIFRDDAEEARQAAYALVANSKSYRGTLDPAASVAQLTRDELDTFSRGLTELLTELKIPCVSRVRAYRSGSDGSDHPLVTVAVTLSSALSFDISGRPFLLRPPQLVDPKAISVSVGCPVAEELVSTSHDHPSEPEGVLVESRSVFAMPVGETRQEISVSFTTPWSLESRRVIVECPASSKSETDSKEDS